MASADGVIEMAGFWKTIARIVNGDPPVTVVIAPAKVVLPLSGDPSNLPAVKGLTEPKKRKKRVVAVKQKR